MNFQTLNKIHFKVNWINQQVTPNAIDAVREGDILGRVLSFTFLDGKKPVDLTGYTAVLAWAHTVGHYSGLGEVDTSQAVAGILEAPVPQAIQAMAGRVRCNLKIYTSDGAQVMSTRTFEINVENGGINSFAIVQTDQYSALDKLIQEVSNLADLENTLSNIQTSMVRSVNGNTVTPGTNDVLLTGDNIIAGGGNFMNVATTLNSLAIQDIVIENHLSNAVVDVTNAFTVADSAVLSSANSYTDSAVANAGTNVLSSANSYTDSVVASNTTVVLSDASSTATSVATSVASSLDSALATSIASSVHSMTGDDFALGSANPITIDSAVTQIQNTQQGVLNTLSTLGTAAYQNTGTAVGNVAQVQSTGKLDPTILPSLTLMNTYVVADETAMLALPANQGDIAIRQDNQNTYILQQPPATTLSNWVQLSSGASGVTSLNALNGALTITSTDGSIIFNGLDLSVDWTKQTPQQTINLANGDDLNNLVGTFSIAAVANGVTTIVNAPTTASPQNFNVVYTGTYDPVSAPGGIGSQILYYADGTTYWRSVSGGTWTTWFEIVGLNQMNAALANNLSSANSFATSVASSAGSSAATSAGSYASSLASSAVSVASVATSSLSSATSSTFASVTVDQAAQNTSIATNSTAISSVATSASSGIASNASQTSLNSSAIASEVTTRSSQVASLATTVTTNSTAISSVASSASSGIASNASTASANSTAIANLVSGTTPAGNANALNTLAGVSNDFNTYTTPGQWALPIATTTTQYSNGNTGVTNIVGVRPIVEVVTYPDGTIYQVMYINSPNAGQQGALSIRTYVSGAWTPWQNVTLSNYRLSYGTWAQYSDSLRNSFTATTSTNIDLLTQTSWYVPSTVAVLGTPPFSGVAYSVWSLNSNSGGTSGTNNLQTQLAVNYSTGQILTRSYNGTAWTTWGAMGGTVPMYQTFTQTTQQAITTASPTPLTGWTAGLVNPNITVSGSTFTINQLGLYTVNGNLGTTSTNNVTVNAKITPISGCTVIETNQATLLANNNNLNALSLGDNEITLNVTSVPATFSFNVVYSYNNFTTATQPSYGQLMQPKLIVSQKIASSLAGNTYANLGVTNMTLATGISYNAGGFSQIRVINDVLYLSAVAVSDQTGTSGFKQVGTFTVPAAITSRMNTESGGSMHINFAGYYAAIRVVNSTTLGLYAYAPSTTPYSFDAQIIVALN